MNKSYNLAGIVTRSLALAALASTASFNASAQCVAPSVGCPGNDRNNAYISSTTPATIEYDNIISLFHSSLARQADGRVLVWGEKIGNSGGNVTTPQELNAANYPSLTGEILKFAAGTQINTNSQHFVLTTTGLFFWGTDQWGLGTTGVTLQKLTIGGQTNGLPAGVAPADVKMLFGSTRILGLVTCSGDAYTLVAATSAADANAYGDGSAYSVANNAVWHRVKINATTNLTGVVALRGNGRFNFIAQTSAGELYTWGKSTYLGDGSAFAARNYATSMNVPATFVPKMIGMTTADAENTSTYFMVATNGALFSLGNNSQKQLGDFTTNARTTWGRVQKSATANDFLENVKWISPNEHDFGYTSTASVNAITADTLLYAWGGNNRQMLGGGTGNATIDPMTNVGGLTAADKIIAVETGGHTTMTIRKCSSNFGYVGHKNSGSMADGTSNDADIPNYTFSTSQMNLCGASTSAATLFPVANATVGNTYNMVASPAGGTFTVLSGPATINASTGAVTINAAGTIQVRYQITTGSCPSTTQVSFTATTPTPIRLEAFNVNRTKNGVVLDWITSKETNSRGFELQRSNDAKEWSTLGFVASQSENGNSIGKLYYNFTDGHPAVGKNYYRLKQVDYDGIFEYSGTKMITYGDKNEINIYPNPVKDKLQIEGLKTNDLVKIIDPSGRVVFQYTAAHFSAEIFIGSLPKGIYYLEILSDNNIKVREKLVKIAAE